MKRRGFTLIELLVVIAIIAILAAILFPVFANAKERARQAKCLSNLKQLTQAFRSYCDDNNGVMPSSCANKSQPLFTYEWTGSLHSASIKIDPSWGQLWKYTHNKGIYICPTDSRMYAAGIKYGIDGTSALGYKCMDYPLSYSLNCEMGSIYGSPAGTEAFLNNLKLDTETAGRSGRVLMLIHEAHENYALEKSMGGGQYGINDGYFSWKTTFNDMPSAVHNEGTTCSYADGHVKWISYNQLLKESDAADATGSLVTSNKYSHWNSNSRRAQNTYP